MNEATLSDIPMIVASMAKLSSVAASTPHDSRARETVRYAMSSKAAIVLVHEGTWLLAIESDNLWAQKRNTQIFAMAASTSEQYDQLIESCLEWFATRKASLIIFYTCSELSEADNALLRAGFISSGSMLSRRKYGTF